MAKQDILDAIDREITKLQQARTLLEGGEGADGAEPAERRAAPKPAAGRPGPAKGTKRRLSEEARARIAAAQKKRWAKNKESEPEEAAAE